MTSEQVRKLQVNFVFIAIPIFTFGWWLGMLVLAGQTFRVAAVNAGRQLNPFMLLLYAIFWWKALRQPERYWNNGLFAIVFAELKKFYDGRR